jgi:hypothetical protein
MKTRLLRPLENVRARDCGDCIEIELPVVLHFAGTLLTLRICPLGDETGYYVLDDGAIFSEFSGDPASYFRLFEQGDKRDHFGIGVSDQCFFKQYDADFGVRVAIDEFIRFFIRLDDFFTEHSELL